MARPNRVNVHVDGEGRYGSCLQGVANVNVLYKIKHINCRQNTDRYVSGSSQYQPCALNIFEMPMPAYKSLYPGLNGLLWSKNPKNTGMECLSIMSLREYRPIQDVLATKYVMLLHFSLCSLRLPHRHPHSRFPLLVNFIIY